MDLDAQLTGGLWWCLQGNSAPWGVTAPHGNKGDTEKFLQQLDIIATLEGSGLMEQDSNQVVSPMSCRGQGLCAGRAVLNMHDILKRICRL